MNPKDDVDKMLADTLAGMMPQQQKRKDTAPIATPAPPAPPPQQPPPLAGKSRQSSPALDKRFQDTLSGLEKDARRNTSPGTVPTPAVSTPAPPPAAARPAPPQATARPATSPAETVRVAIPTLDRVPISQPVFPAAVPTPPP